MNRLNKLLSKLQQKSKRQLTPVEKYSIRLGWMGTGMIMIAPHLLPSDLGIGLYILSGLLLTPQVLVKRQWNLVLININVILAYAMLYYK